MRCLSRIMPAIMGIIDFIVSIMGIILKYFPKNNAENFEHNLLKPSSRVVAAHYIVAHYF